MKIYLIRFAKVFGIPKDESFSRKSLDKIGKIQAERTAKFFVDKNISKLYVDKTIAGEKTAEIIKKQLKENFDECEIPLKNEKEGLERVNKVFDKIKQDRGNIIIISSSDFITSFILFSLGLSLKEKEHFGVKNCSISTIELDELGKVINFDINDYSHILKFSPHYKKQ